jgi:hypothetical protein
MFSPPRLDRCLNRHQHARPDQQAAGECREQRVQALKAQPARHQFAQQRQQCHGEQALDREGRAHARPGQCVKRQVDHEEAGAEGPTAQVVRQEGQPHRAATEHPDLLEHRDAERCEQGAGQQCLGVFEQRMLEPRVRA